ncbi:transcriptional regulator [Pseudonocardia humida]|nr:transcriptional regulator [Pseudonocardia humida]
MTSESAVLHALRCIGSAEAGRVATAAGLAEADAESELIDLAVAGLVTHDRGPFGGWTITPAGKAADAARVAAELDAAGAREVVAGVYDRFLGLNQELLELCTAWQTRSVDGAIVPNDHADAAYDDRVLGLLDEFAPRADAVCAELAAVLPRFGRYATRLGGAVARVGAGERQYFVDDLEAYHTVWFQLHEDLLVTLGIPR